jgi:predicted membrane-bound mannosyltransferase
VSSRWQLPVLVVLVVLLRLAVLHQPIQGDDPYYLYGAEHAQIDPLHPTHAQYIFQGDMVDMRGHPHGPLDSWILGACLAMFGHVNEVPFHSVYILFSLIAVMAMWSLAGRFSDQPFWATLLFIAVPAFVVNGNSFEADLPFLAFWLAAIALFVRATDSERPLLLLLSAMAAALAALDAYQAILLVPILAVYLFEKRRRWIGAWAALAAAPLAIAAFQLFERSTSGALPAAMFTGYMKTYGLQDLVNKFHSGAALTAHAAWIVSPIIAIAAFMRKRIPLIVAIVAALAAAFYDHDPLFWLSIGVGVLVIGANMRRGFLNAWIAISSRLR